MTEKTSINSTPDEDVGATDDDDDDDDETIRERRQSHAGTPSERSPDAPIASSNTPGDKYLVPSEVEAQIKLLWQQHKELLDYIWSRAIKKELRHTVKSGSLDLYQNFKQKNHFVYLS